MTTVWQDNAARFASHRDAGDDDSPLVRAYRNRGSREAVRAIRLGHTQLARSVLFASVEKQARLIGLRDVHLPRHHHLTGETP